MLLGLDFIPSEKISNMSMNGLKRGVATCDKTQTNTGMDEPLIDWIQVTGF
jgi:hypothetical protein